MSNTITIELCHQDRDRLDRIIALLDAIPVPENALTLGTAAKKEHLCVCRNTAAADPAPAQPEEVAGAIPTSPAEPEEAPDADEIPCGPGPEENEAPPAKPIDLADFQAAVARYLANGGDRAALKAHLETTYGVGQVRAVPEDKRAEVLKYIGV